MPESIAEGRDLAIHRRAALHRLIRTAPESALKEAVPMATRTRLPKLIVENLENRVSGVGDLVVCCAFPPAGSASAPEIRRHVYLNSEKYEAFVYGRREGQSTKYQIPLHGIELDGGVALSEDVFRRLEPDEIPLSIQSEGNGTGKRPVVWAEVGGKNVGFASNADLANREAQLRGYETGVNPRSGFGIPAALNEEAKPWNVGTDLKPLTGIKKALVVRVDFSDLSGDPEDGLYTAEYLQAIADAELTPFFARSSYGMAAVHFTVTTNLYRIPEPAVHYLTGGEFRLHQDARKLAAADYALSDFDRLIVVYSSLSKLPGSSINYAGLAELGGERLWVNGEFTFRVLAHELGHSFGLSHANLWMVSDGDPLSPAGRSLEYGDPFDAMGSNFANDRRVDYNMWHKVLLGWLDMGGVPMVSAPGTYRVFAFDQGAIAGKPPALRLKRDDTRTFWIGCRRQFTDNAGLSQGAYVVWGYNSARACDLLDFNTPGVNPRDAALELGQTVIDNEAKIWFSVVAAGGSPPEQYIDVQVRLGASPPIISQQPCDVRVALGQDVVLQIKGDGIPHPVWQWQRQPAGTTEWTALIDGEFVAGSQRETLVVRNASLSMSGDKFKCVVSSPEGTVESALATLDVRSHGIFTLAGQVRQYGSADGCGSLARFGTPGGLVRDTDGNIYVADSQGCTIRKVLPGGEASTFAGWPETRGYANGELRGARFDWPRSIAMDSLGTFYIADHGNSVIRTISPDGQVGTLAGEAGTPGSNDGVGDSAHFRCPWGIAVDQEGDVFVSDVCDNTVRRITPGGVVSTIAGLAGVRGTQDGPGSGARFRDPNGLTIDVQGNLYVADLSNSTIRKISPDGNVSTIAGVPQTKGNLDGPANQALFAAPSALAVDGDGNVYVADRGNNNIRRISANGMVTTVAGPSHGNPGGGAVTFNRPAGIAVAPGGLYVSDTDNQVIRWILLPPEPPILQIALNTNGILVRWPASAGTFVLESAEVPNSPANWKAISAQTYGTSGDLTVQLPPSGAGRLFRLRSQ